MDINTRIATQMRMAQAAQMFATPEAIAKARRIGAWMRIGALVTILLCGLSGVVTPWMMSKVSGVSLGDGMEPVEMALVVIMGFIYPGVLALAAAALGGLAPDNPSNMGGASHLYFWGALVMSAVSIGALAVLPDPDAFIALFAR